MSRKSFNKAFVCLSKSRSSQFSDRERDASSFNLRALENLYNLSPFSFQIGIPKEPKYLGFRGWKIKEEKLESMS